MSQRSLADSVKGSLQTGGKPCGYLPSLMCVNKKGTPPRDWTHASSSAAKTTHDKRSGVDTCGSKPSISLAEIASLV